MSEAYQITDPGAPYFVTFQIVDWVDLFTRQVYRDIFLDSLSFCRIHKGLQVYGYVVMSNHVHLILRASAENLPAVVRDLKKFTSATMLKTITQTPESRREWLLNRFAFAARKHTRNSTYQLWTHENHAILLSEPEFARQKLNYVHLNPVRAGLVEKPEDYLYSSARNYAGLPALMEIDLM
jgi:REP element-mobilizing transposase RayT